MRLLHHLECILAAHDQASHMREHASKNKVGTYSAFEADSFSNQVQRCEYHKGPKMPGAFTPCACPFISTSPSLRLRAVHDTKPERMCAMCGCCARAVVSPVHCLLFEAERVERLAFMRLVRPEPFAHRRHLSRQHLQASNVRTHAHYYARSRIYMCKTQMHVIESRPLIR